ncbi:MAG: hypothetical protein H0Z33_17255, partial [Bacillaceae bacterium]|nr:hypothetical protein [Bacillaceae bacterium]
ACKYLVKIFKTDKAFYWNVNDLGGFEPVLESLKGLEGLECDRVALVFDDISYAALVHSKVVDEFLRYLSVIRRKITAKHYLIITVQHYPYATLPFLRNAIINGIFSIHNREEFKYYTQIFPPRYVKKFIKLYRESVVRGKGEGLALIGAAGFYEITRFPYTNETPWEEPEVQEHKSSEAYYIIDKTYKYAHKIKRNGTIYVYAQLRINTLREILEKALAEGEEVVQIPLIRLRSRRD